MIFVSVFCLYKQCCIFDMEHWYWKVKMIGKKANHKYRLNNKLAHTGINNFLIFIIIGLLLKNKSLVLVVLEQRHIFNKFHSLFLYNTIHFPLRNLCHPLVCMQLNTKCSFAFSIICLFVYFLIGYITQSRLGLSWQVKSCSKSKLMILF